MYVDFTHENSQIAVYAAMGLFNISKALDPKKMERKPEEREWVASRMVPFSGRMVVEKLMCRTADGLADSGVSRGEDGALTLTIAKRRAEYVRIFVNEAPQPLDFCGAKKEGKMEGLCALDAFVESQGYARRNGDGDFEKCYN